MAGFDLTFTVPKSASVLWALGDVSVQRASKPRVRRARPATWDAEQLGAFLAEADKDRFRALWVLAATTGMRRSELAGAERHSSILKVAPSPSRPPVSSSMASRSTRTARPRAAGAPFRSTRTRPSILREHLAMLDTERLAWDDSCPVNGKLICFEDGRPLHPDTITRRFNRLVDKTGLPRITLHGVRHSYATVAMDAGANAKTLSERIGHSSVGFTMQTYVQRSAGRDRDIADTVASLIVPPVPVDDEDPR